MFDVPTKVLPLFFRLPNAVFIHILSEWLHIRDVGRLDTAMTTRPRFLQHLQDMRSITVNANRRERKSCIFLSWLSCRRIFAEELEVWDLHTSIIENLELPSVRKLQIYIVNPFQTTTVMDTNMINLVKSCPALRSFSIFAFSGIFHEVFRQVADHCPMLKELDVLCKFVVDDLVYLLNKCSAFTTLRLHNCEGMKGILSPVAGSFWDSNNWERLRPYGYLIYTIGIYDSPPAFADFLGACPRLRVLSCANSDDSISSDVLLRAAQSCPLLEAVHIQAYTTAALLELSQKCKKLQKMTFLNTRSRPGLPTTDLKIFNQIETLEELRLCVDLTSDLISALSGFRNLKILDLDKFDNVDAIFTDVKFAGTPISRTLEKISFAGGRGVIPIAFLSCISTCTNLREISLDMGCRCDDACYHILATHFPLLATIALNYIKEHVVGLKLFIAQSHRLKKVILMLSNPSYGYHTNDNEAKAEYQSVLNDLRSSFRHIHFDVARF